MREMTEELKFIDIFPEDAGKLAQRLKIKKDEIPFIRKSYISEKSEIDKKERSVISYISTLKKDRDDEQLMPDGASLDNYRLNPIVLYGHDYKSLPIGKNIWIKQDEKGLIAKTIFAKSEFADQIYRAYTEDIDGTGPLLKGWSVGFIPRKWEEPKEKDADEKDLPRRIYTEWELLEYSAVPIPSCPEALTLAYEKGIISDRLKKDLDLDIEIEDFQEDLDDVIADKLDELEAKSSDANITLDEPEEKDVAIDQEEEDLGNVSTEQIKAVMGVKDAEAETVDEQAITIQELKAILADIKELLAKPADSETEITIEPDENEADISEERIRELVAEKIRIILEPERFQKMIDETVKLELKRLKGLVE